MLLTRLGFASRVIESGRRRQASIQVRKCPDSSAGSATMGFCKSYESGLASMFAGKACARSALRRQVLYCRAQHRNLLPADLSGANFERKQCLLFPDCGRGRRGRFSPVFTLPPRMLSRHSGLGWHSKYSLAGLAVNLPERIGRWRRGSRGASWSWLASSSASLCAALGSNTQRCRPDPPFAFREKTH